MGLDDEIQLNDGAKLKISSIVSELSPLEINQIIESVRPISYRVGDGDGGGDGGGCGPCQGDGCNPADNQAIIGSISTSVSIASNVAIVGEMAIAIAAVAITVKAGAVNVAKSLMFSPLTPIVLEETFKQTEVYDLLHQEGLSDVRKQTLLKHRFVAEQPTEEVFVTSLKNRSVELSFLTKANQIHLVGGRVTS